MQNIRLYVLAICLLVFTVSLEIQCLRCGTEELLSNEDVKKMVDTCRQRVGENETENDYDNDDDIDDDDNDGDEDNGRRQDGRNSQKPYNHNGFNYQSDFQNDPYNPNYGNVPRMDPNYRTQSGRNGNMGNMGGMSNTGNMGGMSSMGNSGNTRNMGNVRSGMSNAYGTYDSNSNSNSNNNHNNNNWGTADRFGNGNSYQGNQFNQTDANFNQTKQDRECFLHCVFHEMKMTNNDNFPDKRKMLQVLTKNIRNHELKEFYVDSIQECFFAIDNMDTYRRRKDKCEVSAMIVSCLAERAKTNCDDIQNSDANMLLF